MSNEYNSLKKRIDALCTETDNKTLWYSLGMESTGTYKGGTLYTTPDAALTEIYKDARRRHAAYIAVVSFPFSDGQLQGEDVGYSWSRDIIPPLTITPEQYGHSFLCLFGEYCTKIAALSYPEEQKKNEYLSILEEIEIRWVNEAAGFKTVAEYKRRNEEQNPEIYPADYLTNTERLRQVYCDEGRLD